jgi:hypothetical protein
LRIRYPSAIPFDSIFKIRQHELFRFEKSQIPIDAGNPESIKRRFSHMSTVTRAAPFDFRTGPKHKRPPASLRQPEAIADVAGQIGSLLKIIKKSRIEPRTSSLAYLEPIPDHFGRPSDVGIGPFAAHDTDLESETPPQIQSEILPDDFQLGKPPRRPT